MATVNKTLGGTSGHPGSSMKRLSYMVERIIDFSVDANSAGDVFQALNLPAHTVVDSAGVDVLVAGTGTGTITLVDSAAVTTYVAAFAPTATGQATRAQGKDTVYGTAATLNLNIATASVNARVRVWAILTDASSYANEAIV